MKLISLQVKIIFSIKKVEWIKILNVIIIWRALLVIKFHFT